MEKYCRDGETTHMVHAPYACGLDSDSLLFAVNDYDGLVL